MRSGPSLSSSLFNLFAFIVASWQKKSNHSVDFHIKHLFFPALFSIGSSLRWTFHLPDSLRCLSPKRSSTCELPAGPCISYTSGLNPHIGLSLLHIFLISLLHLISVVPSYHPLWLLPFSLSSLSLSHLSIFAPCSIAHSCILPASLSLEWLTGNLTALFLNCFLWVMAIRKMEERFLN